MATIPLSNVDTAWLRMEAPTNSMMITGVMAFETPIDYDQLKATIENRLLRFNRFRQRVVPSHGPMGTPRWQDVDHLDLTYHLQQIDLPPPGGKEALQELVSRLMSTPLDFSRPLWQFHLVRNVDDGCAIVARLHHCIADGIALIQVLFSLTDGAPAPPPAEAEPARHPGRVRRLLNPVVRPMRSAYRTTAHTAGLLWHEGLETLVHPAHAVDLARLATDSATALGRLALRWPDPKTLFKGPLGKAKRAAWSEPIALQQVKEIGRGLGGTVNDILLTAVSGGLRRYMQERGAAVDGLAIRGVIPVNLRAPGSALDLGNKFGLIFLTLPIGVDDPLERLHRLKCCMDDIKRTPEAAVALGILNVMGMTASQIQDLIVTIFGTKGTAVMTNVPGPREKLYVAGARLSTVMAWVPQSGALGLGVSIISYAGEVRMGIATDQGLVPDPERIVALLQDEFASLLALARTQTAGRGVRPMLAVLDQALATLDSLQAERQVQAKATPPKQKSAPRPRARRSPERAAASIEPAAPQPEPAVAEASPPEQKVVPTEPGPPAAEATAPEPELVLPRPEPAVPAGMAPEVDAWEFAQLWPASRPVSPEAGPIATDLPSAPPQDRPPAEVAPVLEIPWPMPALLGAGTCQALTRVGVPCKNRALPGSAYCRAHQQRGALA